MQIIKDFYSANGGTNNIEVIKIFDGYSLVKCFRGKTAMQRAKAYCRNNGKFFGMPIRD